MKYPFLIRLGCLVAFALAPATGRAAIMPTLSSGPTPVFGGYRFFYTVSISSSDEVVTGSTFSILNVPVVETASFPGPWTASLQDVGPMPGFPAGAGHDLYDLVYTYQPDGVRFPLTLDGPFTFSTFTINSLYGAVGPGTFTSQFILLPDHTPSSAQGTVSIAAAPEPGVAGGFAALIAILRNPNRRRTGAHRLI